MRDWLIPNIFPICNRESGLNARITAPKTLLKLLKYRGLLEVQECVRQNLSAKWIDARSSLVVSLVRNDEAEALFWLVILRFNKSGQGGRKNEQSV
jgi:hypothetical protein